MIRFYILIIFALSNLYASSVLTRNDNIYLSKIKSIKICSTSNNMPFEGFGKENVHIGMVSSYFRIFEQELNVNIKIVKTSTTMESLEFLNKNKCDAISISSRQYNDKELLYTSPYIVTPIVMAIKSPVPFITDFYNLKNKNLIICENAPYKKELIEKYSDINKLSNITSTRIALQKVDRGEAFGAIGTLAEIGYYFYQDYMGELKIAGKTDHVDLKLSMLFKNENKELFLIVNKIINNLPKDIHYDIVSKWTSISYGIGIPSKIIYISSIAILIIFLIIFLFIFILNRKIKQAVKINHEKDKQLFLQSRLAQMGELLSMISHQWRQPLGIMGTIIIKMQLSNENIKFDKDLKDINNYIQYLSDTLNDFSNFYKPNKQRVNIDITIPVKDAINIIQPSIAKYHINLKINFISHRNLNIFSSELTQVILIILQNSIDNFIEQEHKQPHIDITIDNKNSDIAYVKIEDNGGGIDDKIIDKIFDPYFSTKLEKNGTGLGLYMAKLIIEKYHNGKLDVFNTKNGACFEIIFKSCSDTNLI